MRVERRGAGGRGAKWAPLARATAWDGSVHGRPGRVGWLGQRLQEGGSHVGGDGGELGGSLPAQVSEGPVAGGGVVALGAPHHLAAAMAGNQGEGAVALADDMWVILYLGDRPARLPGQPTKESRWPLFLAW